MRVLLADKLAPQAIDLLTAGGCSLHNDPTLKEGSLAEALATHKPDILVVRSTKVNEAHFDAAPGLSLVIRAGAGVNTIAVDAASARGIYVANCPGKNAVAVAELTLGHMLNADRRIADNVADLRKGAWKKKTYAKDARGLKGRTLAIIGLGAIGQEVAHRAKAFGMNIVAFDPALTSASAEALGVTRVDSPLAAAEAADVLSIHVGLNDHTRGMVNAELLGALKPGSTFINASRGGLVDEAALADAVRDRGLRVGLDVFCNEPPNDGPWQTALASLDGVYGTHHIGASTDQASEAVGEEVVRIAMTYMTQGEVPNCVNLLTAPSATHLLVVRHRDEVGVLAGVLSQLREDGINVQEMENIVFRGGHAACARIQVNRAPSAATMAHIQSNDPVHAASVVALES